MMHYDHLGRFIINYDGAQMLVVGCTKGTRNVRFTLKMTYKKENKLQTYLVKDVPILDFEDANVRYKRLACDLFSMSKVKTDDNIIGVGQSVSFGCDNKFLIVDMVSKSNITLKLYGTNIYFSNIDYNFCIEHHADKRIGKVIGEAGDYVLVHSLDENGYPKYVVPCVGFKGDVKSVVRHAFGENNSSHVSKKLYNTNDETCDIILNTGRFLTAQGFYIYPLKKRENDTYLIKFEDNTLLDDVSHVHIMDGRVKHPTKKISDALKRDMEIKERREYLDKCNICIGTKVRIRGGRIATILDLNEDLTFDIKTEDGELLYDIADLKHFNPGKHHKKKQHSEKASKKEKKLSEHIGKKVKTKDGQVATIIEFRNQYDIDIQLSDGYILRRRTYSDFEKGNIYNPAFGIDEYSIKEETIMYAKIKASGMSRNQTETNTSVLNGEPDYSSSSDDTSNRCINRNLMTLELSDIKDEHTLSDDDKLRLEAYLKRRAANAKSRERMAGRSPSPEIISVKVGDVKRALNGQMMKIIEIRSDIDIDVQFEDGTIVKHKTVFGFKNGHIGNPSKKVELSRLLK